MADIQKVAFVTGAGGFIGSTVAKMLASEGIAVAVCDLNEENAKKTADEINSKGGRAIRIKIDVADSKNVDEAVAKTVEAFGRLDISVHVAGGSERIAGVEKPYRPLYEQEDCVIDTVLKVNLYGAMYVSRAASRVMVEQGEGGRIINFSSTVGINGLKTSSAYAAAKGGVISLTKALAKELGEHKITVNSVAPGVVCRPENEDEHYIYETNFLHERCGAEDIANMVVYLTSDKAKFITGQVYVVDGGRSLAMKGTD